jgi:hypothetical protein
MHPDARPIGASYFEGPRMMEWQQAVILMRSKPKLCNKGLPPLQQSAVTVAAASRGLAPTAFQLIPPPKVFDLEYYDGLTVAEPSAVHVAHAAEHSELACQAEQFHQGLRGPDEISRAGDATSDWQQH